METGWSSGLERGTAGYIKLRKESLVCLFTCNKADRVILWTFRTDSHAHSHLMHSILMHFIKLKFKKKLTCLGVNHFVFKNSSLRVLR